MKTSLFEAFGVGNGLQAVRRLRVIVLWPTTDWPIAAPALLTMPPLQLSQLDVSGCGIPASTLRAWKGITAEVNSHFLDCYRQLLG